MECLCEGVRESECEGVMCVSVRICEGSCVSVRM